MEPLITSTQNTFVKFVKSLHSKKGRVQSACFLVEGQKCVNELIGSWPEALDTLIVEDGQHQETVNRVLQMPRRVCRVATHVMNAVCESKTPQGIAAVAKIPQTTLPEKGFIIAMDEVQDPQNVGTIIRTGDAAGCAGVALSQGSADCYSPKAVRASMGSLFHLPVVYADLEQIISGLRNTGYSIACGDLSGTEKFSLDPNNTCLVIGNESRGISENILRLSTHRIRIPIYGRAESLNAAVAAGILIYKIRT